MPPSNRENSHMYDILKFQQMLQKKQNPHRYLHTLGVAYTSVALAMCYQADLEQAEVAGLLHDCAKHMSDDKKLEICKINHIEISKAEAINPFLLHAKVGAYKAREKFGIIDTAILDAIRYHTTGRPNMTLLEQIIFVADYVEPYRNQAPDLPKLRHLAFQDLNQTTALIAGATLDYLKANGGEIDPTTEETYAYYKNLQEAPNQ